jgi:small GTP-binding protein
LGGKNFQDLDGLNIYNYPTDQIKIENKDLISKIIYGHDHGDLIQKYRNGKKAPIYNESQRTTGYRCIIDTPVPQFINDLNIYTTCINGKIIIGLIFDKDDNPYDYKQIFEELLHELLNNEFGCKFEDEIEIENFMITLFIDIRRFGDECVDKLPEIEFQYQEGSFAKVFLFGVDEVGKTSLVRRIIKGEFNDNYFPPTRKFTIEYFQEDRGLLSIWDMPGQKVMRSKWLKGLQDSNIIIYMVDVANQVRFGESKVEFWKILNRYELIGIPLIVICNKCDLINQSDDPSNQTNRLKDEICKYFEFEKIENRDWKFLFTSVKTNYNINTVIDSIFNLI